MTQTKKVIIDRNINSKAFIDIKLWNPADLPGVVPLGKVRALFFHSQG